MKEVANRKLRCLLAYKKTFDWADAEIGDAVLSVRPQTGRLNRNGGGLHVPSVLMGPESPRDTEVGLSRWREIAAAYEWMRRRRIRKMASRALSGAVTSMLHSFGPHTCAPDVGETPGSHGTARSSATGDDERTGGRTGVGVGGAIASVFGFLN